MSINYHALARPIKLSLVSTAKNEKRLIVHSKIYVHKSVNKFALPDLYTRKVKKFNLSFNDYFNKKMHLFEFSFQKFNASELTS